MAITHSHKLVLPADANHHGTLYAGAMLRLVLEAGYATAWKHIGPEANLVLRRVLNMECLRPVPVGVVVEIQGAVLHRTAAYLVCGLVGMPLDDGTQWAEALFGFAQVSPDGKLTHFPASLPAVSRPAGEVWERLEKRMNKLLRLR
ncbi:hotdog domain-containing protein [Gemmata sp. JC717]|uniref:acyl-CoA thioesterase n=1 Tax=Gemmata algarum TaxID=2975278 RepID=UPI0021BB5FEB|nr:hotdog domain-containing protein [Gemmata algarum]MDY3551066.1 hotdog domain-containing protein [Gemmata algarum]